MTVCCIVGVDDLFWAFERVACIVVLRKADVTRGKSSRVDCVVLARSDLVKLDSSARVCRVTGRTRKKVPKKDWVRTDARSRNGPAARIGNEDGAMGHRGTADAEQRKQ